MTVSVWRRARDGVASSRATELELRSLSLHHVVADADPNQQSKREAQVILLRGHSLEPGKIEFHGQAISCLVRRFFEHGAAVDVICARGIPDRFMLELPLEGISYECRLMWRRETEIGVSFQ